jgi:hypothetical protein
MVCFLFDDPKTEGSQGYGGPFRQSITALSTYLRRSALSASKQLTSPNAAAGSSASSAASSSSKAPSAAAGSGAASSHSSDAAPPLAPLLILCPNGVNQVGSDRDKLLLNPTCTSAVELQCYYALGQLMGVAIRSKTCLEVDLAAIVWKTILDVCMR